MVNKTFRMKPFYIPAALSAIAFVVLLFIFPSQAGAGATYGLKVCGEIVIPSLFPFMCVAIFLSKIPIPDFLCAPLNSVTKLLFGNSESVPVIFSFVSGFPVGAKLINEQRAAGLINDREAMARLSYSVNAGPAFIITAVGSGLLSSDESGLLLFISISAASVINGIIFSIILKSRRLKDNKKTAVFSGNTANMFVESVELATRAMIELSGFIILFSCVTSIMQIIITDESILRPLSQTVEVTTGTILSAGSPLPVIAAGIGFGGLSVILQVICCLKNVKINFPLLFAERLIHALLSYIITFGMMRIFTISTSAVVSSGSCSPYSGFSVPLALSMCLMAVVLICTTNQTISGKN